MTSALGSRDAIILAKLTQVVAMCVRNGWGTASDVARVAECHLPNPHTLRRALLNERARNDAAAQTIADRDRTIRRLRAQLEQRQQARPLRVAASGQVRVVELTPHAARALDELCAGATSADIADHLHVTPRSAINLVSKIVRTIDAADRAQAIALVMGGAVRVNIRDTKRKRDAA